MNQKINRLTNYILKIILPLTAFLTPLFFLPLTNNFFNPAKQLLLIFLASISLIVWTFRFITQKQVRFSITPATTPLLLLSIIYIVSSFFQASNTPVSLLGRTTTIASLFFIFLTVSSSQDKKVIKPTLNALILSSSLLSLVTIAQYLNLGQITSIPWLQNQFFNPAGSLISLLTLLVPLLATTIYLGFTKKGIMQILYFVSSSLIIVASIMAVSLLLPQDDQTTLVILPFTAGWSIAVDILKNLRYALIGIGPENFSSAFTRFKPLSINNTGHWNTRFSNSSNHYFHLLTTTGILGFLFYILATIKPLISSLKQTVSSGRTTTLHILLGATLLVQLLVPINVTLLTLTFTALTLLFLHQKSQPATTIKQVSFSLSSDDNQTINLIPWALFIPTLTLIGFTGYFQARAYAADTVFYSSLKAIQNNQGVQAYNQQIRAVQLKPYSTNFRISYSQTNLALANSIASQPEDGQLTEQQRANVTQLIQQSIQEAKNATQLEPTNVATWSNLANIYRQLINLAQDAEQWAIAAYTQALRLDPLNPQLRIGLGSLHYSLENYQEAIELFKQATNAKPDMANAYYNLSVAYRDTDQLQKSLRSLRITAELLEPTSDDYQTVQDQISQLEEVVKSQLQQQAQQAQQQQQQPGSQLQTPTPIPSPTIEPIELPDESGLQVPPEETEEEAQADNQNADDQENPEPTPEDNPQTPPAQ